MNFFNNLINYVHSIDKINKKYNCLRFHFIEGKSIIIAFLLILTVMATILPVSLIMYHIPLGHNEGWNAYNIEQAMHPELGPLYPEKNNGLIFNNYPPLSYYIVGLFDKITMHDYIISGRIVNLFFILISVFCVSSVVVMIGGGHLALYFQVSCLSFMLGIIFKVGLQRMTHSGLVLACNY